MDVSSISHFERLIQFHLFHFHSRPRITVTGYGVSAAAVTFVPPASDLNSTELGTVYPFADFVGGTTDVYNNVITIHVNDQPVDVIVFLDGYCTRTGDDASSVTGYCHYTWSFMDPENPGECIGAFSGQGVLPHAGPVEEDRHGSITVTGGNGLFTAVAGVVEVDPAVFDFNEDPPIVGSLPEGEDIFDAVDGYLHSFVLEADAEFFVLTAAE